ncbi:MAG: hypothetical protein ABR540_15565 [Acidimicrobiales bacterium]
MRRWGWPYGLVLVSALAVGVGAVAAQPEPPGQLTILPTSGPGGTTITVTGNGCSPPAEIGVFLFDEGAQRNLDRKLVNAEPAGTWSALLLVPAGFQPTGRVLVGATCGEDAEYRAQVFTVTALAGPAQPTPGSPALTG